MVNIFFKKYLIIKLVVFFSINSFSQTSYLNQQELENKIIIESNIKSSKSNLIVSTSVTVVGLLISTNKKISKKIGMGGVFSGIINTTYHFIRYKIFISKKKKFYHLHNIPYNN